ncbi:MAG: hypothetical protein IPJ88_10625 [Myxococcales bacterium]|nr:MAG: hypothetical protein IPJ88_10625 [Myxococcales bacterium]
MAANSGCFARTTACLWFVVCIACSDTTQTQGDHGPVAENISAALGEIIPSATNEEREAFERGKQVALRRFKRSDGLGPAFNVTFCASCHEKPTLGGGSGLYRNFILAGTFDEQNGFSPAQSAGPAGGVIRKFYYGSDENAQPSVPQGLNVLAVRNAIPFFGIGLLSEVDDTEILSREDPNDLDGDGISGKANYQLGVVGRFGRKAQTNSIEGFVRGPLFNHLGITTEALSFTDRALLPFANAADLETMRFVGDLGKLLEPFAQAAINTPSLEDDDGVDDPELSNSELFDLVSFALLLAAPQIEELDESGRKGREIFDSLQCGKCHTPRLKSARGPLPVYSDLLVHDMGSALADGFPMLRATGSEFRTQPLWGIAAVGPYLHDGRAGTIEEAIEAHGGEAQRARDEYMDLTEDQKAELKTFLLLLGGRAQSSPGLLPQDAAVPDVGEYGGPYRALDDSEQASFLSGRRVFDKEFYFSDGVGNPGFNGDSCRACHFDPVIGGSGPRGVNAMRTGSTDSGGNFIAPSGGTLLPRLGRLLDPLVKPEAQVSIFEHRQTPSLFGLGLIETISDDEIKGHADPNDDDSDGISGRVSMLAGDVIGRFGWKAQIPSLEEFTRDAIGAELGMSMAEKTNLSFGITEDNDGIPDPEFSDSEAEALLFFLKMLAPPPRQDFSNDAQVMHGESVFETIGCASCHIPILQGEDGPVVLYSDLLLHEVLPITSVGIEDGPASMVEFRTAPLWGISQTDPYMHSGEADTLAEAIELHDGEAGAVRDAYLALSDGDRQALMAFLNSL